MTKEINIGGKPYIFTANGATPLFYKQFFHEDLLQKLSLKGENLTIATEDLPQLAFIMAKQGEKADMMQLKKESYIEWLTQFNPMDIPINGEEIFLIYVGDSIQTSEPKKKASGKAKG